MAKNKKTASELGVETAVEAKEQLDNNADNKSAEKGKKSKQEKQQKENKKANKKKEKKQSKIGKKFKETSSELKKVIWPSFGSVVKKTGVVLAVVLIFAVVLFGIDRLLAWLFDLLTNSVA